MARRLENADMAYLLDNINSDFEQRSKEGKIHFIDSYCELLIRHEPVKLSNRTLDFINKEFDEISLFSKIKSLEEYHSEYEKNSQKYADAIKKYAKMYYRPDEKSGFDIFENSQVGKLIFGIGGITLAVLAKKSGLLTFFIFRNNPEPLLIFFEVLVIAAVIGFLAYISYYVISPKLISSKEKIIKRIKRQPSVFKYLQRKWFSDRDVMLILLSIEHYSDEPYDKIIKRLGDSILNDKRFFVKVVYRNSRVYPFLPEEYKNDKDVTLSYLKGGGDVWQGHIEKKILIEREIVNKAFEYEKDSWLSDKLYFTSWFLRELPDEYKRDREFIKPIIKLNGGNFEYVDASLQDDAELLEIAKSSDYPYGKRDW